MCLNLVPGLCSSQGMCSNTYDRFLGTNMTLLCFNHRNPHNVKNLEIALSRKHWVFNFSSIAQPCIKLQNFTITRPTPCAPVPQHFDSKYYALAITISTTHLNFRPKPIAT